jgi:hypothetical protein
METRCGMTVFRLRIFPGNNTMATTFHGEKHRLRYATYPALRTFRASPSPTSISSVQGPSLAGSPTTGNDTSRPSPQSAKPIPGSLLSSPVQKLPECVQDLLRKSEFPAISQSPVVMTLQELEQTRAILDEKGYR